MRWKPDQILQSSSPSLSAGKLIFHFKCFLKSCSLWYCFVLLFFFYSITIIGIFYGGMRGQLFCMAKVLWIEIRNNVWSYLKKVLLHNHQYKCIPATILNISAKTLIYEAYKLQKHNAEVHKWCASILGVLSDFVTVKQRIQDGAAIKVHNYFALFLCYLKQLWVMVRAISPCGCCGRKASF